MANMVHQALLQQRVAGLAAELGDTWLVAWCTEQPPEAPDTVTRSSREVTCLRCIAMWNEFHPEKISIVESLDEGMEGTGGINKVTCGTCKTSGSVFNPDPMDADFTREESCPDCDGEGWKKA